MREEVFAQLGLGLLEWAHDNKWALPAFLVAKKGDGSGKKRWRMVVNCQPLDKRTRSVGNEVLDQKAVIANVQPHKFKAQFDLLKAFWQVPLAKSSRQYFGIKTPFGVLVPTRLPMGWKNSPAWLQLKLDGVFAGVENLERWVDDCLVHGATFLEFLASLDAFLARCRQHRVLLKPSADMCSPEVEFVGLKLGLAGWSKAPSTYGVVRERPLETAADLAGLIGFFNFFHGTLRQLELLMSPLRDVLNAVHARYGSSTKASDRKVKLGPEVGWTDAHVKVVAAIWRHIDEDIRMALPDPNQRVMIITDASDFAGAGIILQVSEEEWRKPPADRRGQVLAVHTHVFTGVEKNYTTGEKELMPLHYLVTKYDHLLVGREVLALTDHANLVSVLSNPRLLTRAQAVGRVGRRIADMGGVALTVQHIAGVSNGFCDWLSRGGESELTEIFGSVARVRLVRVLRQRVDDTGDLHLPSTYMVGAGAGESAMPTLADVARATTTLPQGELRELQQLKFALDEASGVYRKSTHIWVPRVLRGAALVAAHTGLGGHYGVEATLYHLGDLFWPSRRADVQKALRRRLPCAQASDGTVTRPLGEPLHGTRVGEVLHLDYLDFPVDKLGRTKVLVCKDDVSQMVFTYICEDADSAATAASLRSFIVTHALLPDWVVGDQGSHFEGALKEALEQLGIKRHKHLPYTPMANGTVERANKDVIRGVMTLLSERGLDTRAWSDVLDLAVLAHNSAPSRLLGGRTPHQVFTGRPSGAFRPRTWSKCPTPRRLAR